MELTQSQERLLRRSFRYLNHNMLLMWRLGLCRMMASPAGGFIMVLGTTGRKSGEHRLAPLNFAERNVKVEVVAADALTQEEREAAIGAAQDAIEQQLAPGAARS